MEKEIIIPRKKSKSVIYTIGMALTTLMFLLPILHYFVDITWITSDIPLIAVIICIPCAAICFWCCILYFKQIFNTAPVLVVNSSGIHERMSINSVGLVKWEHIECIYIVPNVDNTYLICLTLTHPEMYIQDPKLLNKLQKRKNTKKWGHITFSSLYFMKDFREVVETMEFYHKKNVQYRQNFV